MTELKEVCSIKVSKAIILWFERLSKYLMFLCEIIEINNVVEN